MYSYVFLLHLITDELTKLDISQVSDKLAIQRLPCTIWPMFSSFFIFSCYFTRLKAHEISRQSIRNMVNISQCFLDCSKMLFTHNQS